MRLEINAFFMHRQDTDSFCRSFEDLTEQAEFVADSFEAVRSELCNVSGGIGCLQNAVDELDARIREENTVAGNLSQLNRQTEDFVDTVLDTDHAIAQLIHKEKDKFYEVNPWAIPPEPETDDRNIFEKGWDALCDTVEDVVEYGRELFNEGIEALRELGNRAIDWVIDRIEDLRELGHAAIEFALNFVKDAWEFMKEHWVAFVEIAIGVTVIIAAIALAPFTGGGSLLIGATVLFAFAGAAVGGIGAALQGGDGGDIFDAAAKGFMGGAFSGFLFGLAGPEASLGMQAFTSGAAGGATEAIDSFLRTGKVDMGAVVKSAVTSAATAVVMSGFGGDMGVSDAFNEVFGFAEHSLFGEVISESLGNFYNDGLSFIDEQLFGGAVGDAFVGSVLGSALGGPVGGVLGGIFGGEIMDGLSSIDLGGAMISGALGNLAPVRPDILPGIDISIDIDVNIDMSVIFDFRPLSFQMPPLSAVLC